jgi:hypothetical protein
MIVGKRWDLPVKRGKEPHKRMSSCFPWTIFPFSKGRRLSKAVVSTIPPPSETVEEVSKLWNASTDKIDEEETDSENNLSSNGKFIVFDIDDTLVFEYMNSKKGIPGLIATTEYYHRG